MDQQLLERFYKLHYPELVLYVNSLVSNRKIAEEIASVAFDNFKGLSHIINNENEIRAILFMHARQAAQQYITNRKEEIQRLQEYVDPSAISFGLEGEL